jgi:hypothetical protein
MANRKALSEKTRFEVFKRDGFKCSYCGRSAPEVLLHVDHIEPVAKGGTNDIFNLVTACADCNAGKSDRPLDDNGVLTKQVEQLQEVNARRQQVEMMMMWRKKLANIDADCVKQIAGIWNAAGIALSEAGKKTTRRIIKKYGFGAVMKATDDVIARKNVSSHMTQYESDHCFNLVEKYCRNAKLVAEKPYMLKLFYVRGICCNRWDGAKRTELMRPMESAFLSGMPLEEIEREAKTATCLRNFITALEEACDA